MKISRTTLLGILKLVSPALASDKNDVQELSCLWFSGDEVSAYDDILGAKASLKTNFTGGVVGEKLIGILENSRAKEVTLEKAKDNNLVVKAGSAVITFALRPFEDWFWDPEVPKIDSFKITGEFIKAIELTLFSVGSGKVQTAEQRGITVIQKKGYADFFTTDAISLSWMKVPTESDICADRVIIPTPYCEQLKKAGLGSDLYIDKDAVYCVGVKLIESIRTKFLLFSRLVDDDAPVDFEGRANEYSQINGSFPVPSRLKMSLDRASILLTSGEAADFEVDDSVLRIFAQSESKMGEIDDAISLKGSEHPNIKVKVDLGILKRGLRDKERETDKDKEKEPLQYLSVTQDCLVLKGPGEFIHILATK